MNDMHNFSNLKNCAINEMIKMSKRATKTGDIPPVNEEKCSKFPNKKQNVSLTDDQLLILGLVLILSNDCNDNLLFLALLYILM